MTSQSSSNQLLIFCNDCGCLRLRDVTDQLQELFTKRAVNSELCGICNKCVLETDSGTKQGANNQDAAGQREGNSDLNKHEERNEQSKTIKFEILDDDDDDGDDIGGGAFDDDNDWNDAETEPEINAATTPSTKDSTSPNLTSASTVQPEDTAKLAKTKKSKVARTRKLKRTKAASRSKVKSKRLKSNQSSPDADTTSRPQKSRVTRLRSGVIKAANYNSLFEGDKSGGEDDDDDDDDNNADGVGLKRKKKRSSEDEEEYRASDGDRNPNDSGDDDEDDIDISQYIVPKNEQELSQGTDWVKTLVPALQNLVVVPGDHQSGRFQCTLCGEIYRFISQFQRHVAASHVDAVGKIDEPFVCAECGRKFARFKLLTKHKYRHAKEFVTYRCTHKDCDFTFKRKDYLISHIQVHKGKKKFPCKICGVGFDSEKYLAVHKTLHSNKDAFSCQYCSKTFSHEMFLRSHERMRHEEASKYKCDLCPFANGRKTEVQRHRAVVHSSESLECERCKVTFCYKSTLDKHVQANKCESVEVMNHNDARSTHDDGSSNCATSGLEKVTKNLTSEVVNLMNPVASISKPFRCRHCPQVQYKSVISFFTHLKEHHSELHPNLDAIIRKPFKCSECDYTTARQPHLHLHQITHTELRPYKCEQPGCDKMFKSKDHLRIHVIRHKGERTFMCSKCGGRFKTKAQLEDHHNAVHLKLKPHGCPDCGFAFAKKEKLKIHVMRVHLKLKPCMCEKCGRGFATTTDLKDHMRAHTGEKPYACDLCDYRAVRSDYLLKHKRTHTGERPYHCKLCNTSFAHRTQFVAHRKKTHGLHEAAGGSVKKTEPQVGLQHKVPPLAVNNIPLSIIPSSSGMEQVRLAENGNNELESKTAVQFLEQHFNL